MTMQNHDPQDPKKIADMAHDAQLQEHARETFLGSCRYNYSYNFKWLGRPIIQYPQDIVAMQEILWRVQPQWVIETGVAHGGSLIFSASMLELIGGPGRVLGIDIDIRAHNRVEIEKHPMAKRIQLLQGSSIDPAIIAQVRSMVQGPGPILVALDSNHTHDHVLRELELYSPLVTAGSYLVVFDTVVEDMPDEFFEQRPWRRGNSPKTAVQAFLKSTDRFAVDVELENKLLLTVAPHGYLKCLKN
jgi:cephalosporin hydroxylase